MSDKDMSIDDDSWIQSGEETWEQSGEETDQEGSTRYGSFLDHASSFGSALSYWETNSRNTNNYQEPPIAIELIDLGSEDAIGRRFEECSPSESGSDVPLFTYPLEDSATVEDVTNKNNRISLKLIAIFASTVLLAVSLGLGIGLRENMENKERDVGITQNQMIFGDVSVSTISPTAPLSSIQNPGQILSPPTESTPPKPERIPTKGTTLLTYSPTNKLVTLTPTNLETKAPVTVQPTAILTMTPISPRQTVSPTYLPPTTKPTDLSTEAPISPQPIILSTNAPVTMQPTYTPKVSPIISQPTASPTTVPLTPPPTASPTKTLVTTLPTVLPTNLLVSLQPTALSTKLSITLSPTEKPTAAPVPPTLLPTSLPTGRTCPTSVSRDWQRLPNIQPCEHDSDCINYLGNPSCCAHPYCICQNIYFGYTADFQCVSF